MAGLDECGKTLPTGIRSPDRPVRSRSLYRLSYPGPRTCYGSTPKGCVNFTNATSKFDVVEGKNSLDMFLTRFRAYQFTSCYDSLLVAVKLNDNRYHVAAMFLECILINKCGLRLVAEYSKFFYLWNYVLAIH
jgi:hypothetical protein